jgi:hypothetical protein
MNLDTDRWGKSGTHKDFSETVRQLLFWSSLECAFGKKTRVLGYPEFYTEFAEFDDQFEMAASPIPHRLLKVFADRKRIILKKLQDFAVNHTTEGTVVDAMVKLFPKPEESTNFLLSALWALETNSLNIVFWTVVHVLIENGLKYVKC